MATETTKAVIFEGRRKMTEVIIRIGDEEIHIIDRTKYLGVVFERNWNFAKHIEAVTSRAERKTMQLSRLLKSSSVLDRDL